MFNNKVSKFNYLIILAGTLIQLMILTNLNEYQCNNFFIEGFIL